MTRKTKEFSQARIPRLLAKRGASKSGKAAMAALGIALVVILAASALVSTARGASGTISFTCLPQAQAVALIQANPPGSMSPDTSACPGLFDGFYTPSTTATSTTTTASSAIEVTGTGTRSSSTNNTSTFIQVSTSTAANPVYVACSGTATAPTTTTSPYIVTQTGTAALTGLVSSNSPGTSVAHSLRNPCAPNTTSTYVFTITTVDTFSSVTVNLPNGQTVTGGLVVTIENTGSALTSTSGTTTTTTSTATGHSTWTGTGGLAGMSGIGESTTQVTTIGSSSTVSSVYWVDLTNVP